MKHPELFSAVATARTNTRCLRVKFGLALLAMIVSAIAGTVSAVPQTTIWTSIDGLNWTEETRFDYLAAPFSADTSHLSLFVDDGPSVRIFVNYHAGAWGSTWMGFLTAEPSTWQWTANPGNPILTAGTWDEYFTPTYCMKDEAGYKLYYAGMIPNSMDVGLATSTDGLTWTKYGSDAVLRREVQAWSSFRITIGSVLKVGTTYYAFYEGDNENLYARNSFGLATSNDGFAWTQYAGNPIIPHADLFPSGIIRPQGQPSVIYKDGMFHMYMYDGALQRNLMAQSTDGITWDIDQDPGLNFPDTGPRILFRDGIYYALCFVDPSLPTLAVTPLVNEVPETAGAATLNVHNPGDSPLNWSASVTEGSDWVSISGSASGTDNGTVDLSYAANTAAQTRNAVIRFEAPGALGSPVDVALAQSGAAGGGEGEGETNGDTTPPAMPTGFSLLSGANEIAGRWDANTEVDLAGYRLYRSDTETGTFALLNAAAPISETRYADTGIVVGQDYWYKLTAVDRSGNESASAGPLYAKGGLIVVTVPDLATEPGGCVRIPVNVANAVGINPFGMDIDFRYDPALVDPTSISVERTAITAVVVFMTNVLEPGRVRISSIGQTDTLLGEGKLFDLVACLNQDAPQGACSALSFEQVKFYDDSFPSPLALPVDYSDTGQFCVNGLCMQGDLDHSGEVDSADVIVALRMAVGLIIPDACQVSAGDLNGDGVIDSADAILIQRLAVGLPVNPPQPGEKALEGGYTLKDIRLAKSGVSVSIPAVDAFAGETVEVTVNISDAAGLSGYAITVSYPVDGLELTNVSTSGLTTGFEKIEKLGDGFVRVAMSNPSAVASGNGAQSGGIAALRFHVANAALAGAVFPIRVNGAELKGQYGDSFAWYANVSRVDGQITVKSGSPEVPNVVGMARADAETAITGAGLVLGTVTEAYSDTVAAGSIVSQVPAGGTLLPGSAVDFVVSKGPQPVDVPNVVGMTQADAETAITSAGLVVGTVTEAYSDTVAAGSIVSQVPTGGTLPPGSAVDLVVSKGPQPVDVPIVVGMTRADAETAITGAGLAVGTVTEAYSASIAAGSIISQVPTDGTLLPGGAVDLVVSKGPQSSGNEGEVIEGEGEGSGNTKFLGCGAGEPSAGKSAADTIFLLGVLAVLALGLRARRSAVPLRSSWQSR